jgi:NADH-quinone oxidoreductase subunit N
MKAILLQFVPEIILLVGGLLFMLIAVVDRDAAERGGLKLAALLTACGVLVVGWAQFHRHALGSAFVLNLPEGFDPSNPQLRFISFTQDGFSAAYKLVIFIGLALTVLLSLKDEDLGDRPRAEYFSLLFFAVLGMCFMASGRDLLTLWVGLETMALATYALVALPRKDRRGAEGAMKYFILGTLSSGLFLYGVSLLYGATGTFQLAGPDGLGAKLAVIYAQTEPAHAMAPLASLGVIILLIALLFKVAAVPFHMWLPDAYTGAPTAITAFMSIAVKTASFAMLLRILYEGLAPAQAVWLPLLSAAAAVTMVWGNVAAVLQTNVKRLLAYSSVAHAGYVLAGVVALHDSHTFSGETAVWFYLLAYTFLNAAAFGVLIWLRGPGVTGEAFEDFAGLGQRAPLLAAVVTFLMLALTGIPTTAGFTAKFAVFSAAVESHHVVLAIVGLAASAISLYYYFRIVVQMYMKPPEREAPAVSAPVFAVVAVGAFATLYLGLFFRPVLDVRNVARLDAVALGSPAPVFKRRRPVALPATPVTEPVPPAADPAAAPHPPANS